MTTRPTDRTAATRRFRRAAAALAVALGSACASASAMPSPGPRWASRDLHDKIAWRLAVDGERLPVDIEVETTPAAAVSESPEAYARHLSTAWKGAKVEPAHDIVKNCWRVMLPCDNACGDIYIWRASNGELMTVALGAPPSSITQMRLVLDTYVRLGPLGQRAMR